MKQIIFSGILFIFCIGFVFNFETNTQTIDVQGPAGSGNFGTEIFALPNGNIVITDPEYDIPNGASNVGAVYLYNGATGTLISTLTGSATSDLIGLPDRSLFGALLQSGVVVLPNGNFVVISRLWNNGSIQRVGAVTYVNETTGLSGVVSPSNSLIGSATNDFSGNRIKILSNGNYVCQ